MTTILIRGFDPLDDAIDYGRHLLPSSARNSPAARPTPHRKRPMTETGPLTSTASVHWPQPAAVAPRGTLVVLPGRGEHALVYERFGRRLAIDGYPCTPWTPRPRTPPTGCWPPSRPRSGPTRWRRSSWSAATPGPSRRCTPRSRPRAAPHRPCTGSFSPEPRTPADPRPGTPADPERRTPTRRRAVARRRTPTRPGAVARPRARTPTGTPSWRPVPPARPTARGSPTTRRSHAAGSPTRTARAVRRRAARPSGRPRLGAARAADPLAPLERARALARTVPRAEFGVVREGRHDVLNDASHRTTAATVVLWLERLRGGPDLEPVLTVEPTARPHDRRETPR
ncbi:hypothetical protein NKH77_54235 [Streptomyces sp. M19]